MPAETLGADALAKLVSLAGQARGVDIRTAYDPSGGEGLPSGIPIAVRHGETPQLVSLKPLFEEWRRWPAAKRGTAAALTLAAFVALTNRHKTRHSAVFADVDWRSPNLTTVVDYHEIEPEPIETEEPDEIPVAEAGPALETPTDPATGAASAETAAAGPDGQEVRFFLAVEDRSPKPGWLRHRIHYAFPLSEAWKAWVEQDGEPMSQGDFAAWIEEHIQDLAAPTAEETAVWGDLFQTAIAAPASLISLSRGLKITVSSTLKDTVDLQSGASQIVFEEEHRDASGGRLTVPGLFVLSIAPFTRGAVARVPVRLRYRATGPRLIWFFQIFRPDDVISAAVDEAIATVRAETRLPVYEGTPEA